MDKDKFFADFLEYSYILILFLSAVFGAVYLPGLGFFCLCFLGANYFDYNKKILRKFFISPKLFFNRNMLITNYHRTFFFAFLIAFSVNLAAGLLRVFS